VDLNDCRLSVEGLGVTTEWPRSDGKIGMGEYMIRVLARYMQTLGGELLGWVLHGSTM
jgi:hypothetical protein